MSKPPYPLVDHEPCKSCDHTFDAVVTLLAMVIVMALAVSSLQDHDWLGFLLAFTGAAVLATVASTFAEKAFAHRQAKA